MSSSTETTSVASRFQQRIQIQTLFLLPGINGGIVYSLPDSADGFFSIDEHTGVISLERALDRELQSSYQLRAAASDLGSPRLSAVCALVVSVLDINDNPPVFEQREYATSVSEDAVVGKPLLRVHAASRDAEASGEISYNIVSGNEHGRFRVDPRTGRSPPGRRENCRVRTVNVRCVGSVLSYGLYIG